MTKSRANSTAEAAKGDLRVGTGTNTTGILSVSSNGYTIVADSSTSTGLKWAAPSSSAISYSLLNAGGTATTSGSTVTVSGLSGYNYLAVYLVGISTTVAGSQMLLRLNSDSTSAYTYSGLKFTKTPTISNAVTLVNGATQFYWADQDNDAASLQTGWLIISGANSSGIKQVSYQSSGNGSAGNYYWCNGMYSGSSVISSISIITSGATFDAGTIYVYGAN